MMCKHFVSPRYEQNTLHEKKKKSMLYLNSRSFPVEGEEMIPMHMIYAMHMTYAIAMIPMYKIFTA